MTLKEQFEEYTDQKSWQKENYDAIECEIIADEFAIGFGKWLIKKEHEYTNKIIATKELLEIYKKEKGL
jgi:hypothetical protein